MVYDLIDYDSEILETELPQFDFSNPPIDPQEGQVVDHQTQLTFYGPIAPQATS